ncbi:hypothetical protein CDAR_27341 [Caerostris darwini]|uniref:Uncharacterized protein n=1 Tax=Caerostris darwini TaxID=1538125 RepID=A0AAV4R6I1_9ARAC|nr:hypothetical protein CDAR_27341 [Caerostris darwini]
MDQFRKTTALGEDTKQFADVGDNGQGGLITPILDIHCAPWRDARSWRRDFLFAWKSVKFHGWLQCNWSGIDDTQVSSKNNIVLIFRLAACHKTILGVYVMSSCYKAENMEINIETN